MTTLFPIRREDKQHFRFLRGFLRRPKQVGSIVPSSRFLERCIVRNAGIDTAKLVVELGPGTGGTTRALLNALRDDARLVAIEINSNFASWLRSRLHDPRLIVHEGSAEDLHRILAKYGLEAADVVLSGIPFSTMSRTAGIAILNTVKQALCPGGRFVAYQMRDRVEALGCQLFGQARVQIEIRNIPPMRVFTWQKFNDHGGFVTPKDEKALLIHNNDHVEVCQHPG
uniref:Phospholipid N-methyltransferase n=1 Tax=Candidatus Kentrum sp. TC TaxID=2126339 RepID=A0A450YRG3_9GAMM|nr:MAG: Phospholipid N-methyltransferase [Candidatus Kentron sp. TC]